MVCPFLVGCFGCLGQGISGNGESKQQTVMFCKLGGSGLWEAGMHLVMDLCEKTLNMSMVVKLERTPPTGAYLVGFFQM